MRNGLRLIAGIVGLVSTSGFVPTSLTRLNSHCLAGPPHGIGYNQKCSFTMSATTAEEAVADSAYRKDVRNIAIVAHVDHGKTTLVDAMLRQSDVFRVNEKVEERIMDSNDQEKERGITILAKNAAVIYKDVKINLVDTPGHADFGGEVERILNMVDSVLLVVDSVEGPKPQTRFVLKKALDLGLKVVVVVNKIDRPAARPEFVVDKTFDLFMELDASDDQIDFEVVYCSALNGIAGDEPDKLTDNMQPLFETILKLPAPKIAVDTDQVQLLVANIDYDDFKGRLGIGRIRSGSLTKGQSVGVCQPGTECTVGRIGELFVFDNLGRTATDKAVAGDIVVFSGIDSIGIGDSIVDQNDPKPLPPIAVEEPTVTMTFGVNSSPLGGREGKLLTSRNIRDRLFKELEKNVALRVTETDAADKYEVSGRGQLHLTVLIETMRREGFELLVGPPQVIYKDIPEKGGKCEPWENVEVTVPEEHMGGVVDLLNRRKGEMIDMEGGGGGEGSGDTSSSRMVYLLPTRGMIGLRSALLTATRGTAVMDSTVYGYRPVVQGEIEAREKGSLLGFEDGEATTFGIINAQDRGRLFVSPKDSVYKNMIVGIHQRPGDLAINVCKTKALNNMRSANKEVSVGVVPPVELTLDSAVEYIQQDELVEITPTKIRMLKNPMMDKKFLKQQAQMKK